MDSQSFTELLRQALDASGLSERRFAAEVGVSHVALGNWLRGGLPVDTNVARIAGTGYVDPDALWLAWMQERRDHVGTMSAAADSGDTPGWNCLRRITRRTATVARTLVPEPSPTLKVA